MTSSVAKTASQSLDSRKRICFVLCLMRGLRRVSEMTSESRVELELVRTGMAIFPVDSEPKNR